MVKDKKLYKILVVEDNPGDFVIVKDFLAGEILDPVITHAVNFRQASEVCLAVSMPFDVILLDLSLPDKNGKELIAEILRIASSCPVIILTGYADIAFSIKSISQGIFDYLLKDDLNAKMLYKSIVYSIERKKSISELEESEKRYSDLFYLSPEPMWVFNTETFRFVQVNKAAIELYGYSEEEYLNMTLMDIKSDEDVPKVKEWIRNGGLNNGTVKRRASHYKKSGEIIDVEMYTSQIVINHKKFGSVIALDVTEKKLYEHKIMKAIIKTQEDERYEIGGELHDNVCQILGASKLYLGMLKGSLPAESMNFFDQCNENICSALDEIRSLSHRLAPAFFDDSTMEESFRRLFNTFTIGGRIELVLHFEDSVKEYPLSRELHLNLYRILQEQLKNILKYAKASVVEVDVLIYNNKVKMKISDNGIGFNVDTVKGGIGLANMKRRTELFSGIFEIDSSPGIGCTILIDIPLQQTHELNKSAV